ncbi:Transducin/WD40 repeat-like superfamily protein [Prunus dulcis]|uniref:Transducin/WD40 repeat-like superfamily protein n=1 Tax=Prunus dulcis TaxID=3755 RepID=A0A5H2XGL1_PRUDU|nr:Transducin/WD40 repeat-like superfamily protein [Prunus dulcis]
MSERQDERDNGNGTMVKERKEERDNDTEIYQYFSLTRVNIKKETRLMDGWGLEVGDLLIKLKTTPHLAATYYHRRKKTLLNLKRPPGGNCDGLKGSDIEPRLLFHYGIPSGCNMLAYDPIQKILAVSSKDGRIKLVGKDSTQAVLESVNAVPSKFLQFVENQGILVNVNSKNHIEIWDIEKNLLADVHAFEEDITSFTVMLHSLYMYVGDSAGNVRVLKLEQEHIVQMKYTIPYSPSHGNPTEETGDTSVIHVLPQPAAESKRVLIIFRDGIISLWDIRERKTIFTAGGNALQSLHHEGKKVTSACWACPFGSKVAVGYSNGDIFIWSVSTRTELPSEPSTQSTPIFKLNVGYKLDKIRIASLRWVYADGKARNLYAYDDCSIEKYLLQSQSKSSPSLPKEVMVKIPFVDSNITVAKFITDNTQMLSFADESEDDLSLSGIPVTALFFDANSRLLVSGDQSGMVRIFRLKPEPYANVSSFLSLQGSTKKGNDHIIQSGKLLKVSVLDTEGPTVLYQKHIASEISTGIICLHFQTCSFHGFDKNVLAVATEDSSVLALDSDNGNTLSTSLDVKRLNLLNGLDLSKGSPVEDVVPKQSLLLLCFEKAAYGVKKVIYKKKFQASCCWASTFYTSSDVLAGVILNKGDVNNTPLQNQIHFLTVRYALRVKENLIVGSKAKNVPEIETEDTKESFKELSMIFSTANFTVDAENTDEDARDEDELDLVLSLFTSKARNFGLRS